MEQCLGRLDFNPVTSGALPFILPDVSAEALVSHTASGELNNLQSFLIIRKSLMELTQREASEPIFHIF